MVLSWSGFRVEVVGVGAGARVDGASGSGADVASRVEALEQAARALGVWLPPNAGILMRAAQCSRTSGSKELE
jgi:hypothetical protein